MNTELQLSQEEKNFGMLAHLTALAGCFIPFGNILGPLVIWLTQRDQSAWVDQNGKESLNFQISIYVYAISSLIFTLILTIFLHLIAIVLGLFLLMAVVFFSLAMVIIASIKTNNGEDYRYPFNIRFLK